MRVHRPRCWLIRTDPGNAGLAAGWAARIPDGAAVAPVPGIIQQVFPDYHGVAWYWCELPAVGLEADERALLRFESAGYGATIWLNGEEIGAHEGELVPFELDATDALLAGQANLLAVRIVNPAGEPIDGLVLSEVPHSNKALPEQYRPGWGYNAGGITGEVVLHVEPATRLADVFVRAELATGVVLVEVRVAGPGGDGSDRGVGLELSVLVTEDRSGLAVTGTRLVLGGRHDGDVPDGFLRVSVQVPVDELRAWDLDDPFLYRVSVRLEPVQGGAALDERTVRTGFRQLRVRDGWFELNGRRIYLRSTHTGNHYPIGQEVPPDPAMIRQDLVYAKAAGYNTVRFIASPAREDQLSFCDELGLMVYEETRASWLLADSPRMAEHFDRSFDELILRDRNHPSVVIWGLLNETYDGPVFRHAVDYLTRLRQLDDTRLVLLSSGRWDGDLAIGSVSNPGESSWQHEWGDEAHGAAAVAVGWADDLDRAALVPGEGDLHLYPYLPESARAKNLLATLGSASKPVFLSEYGVGSLFDAVTALAQATCYAARNATGGAAERADPPDVAYIRAMVERFLEDWERFGMAEMYCFPEDALIDSQLNQSLHRAVTFDLIRANPRIAGYNLTGMLDHALSGEGPWTFWRRFKPYAMEATSEGWAPLRWCLTASPAVTLSGEEVQIDLSLANEDVLAPGSYTARLAVIGPDGWRTERSRQLRIEDGQGPLALQVLSERITLDGAPGHYRCAATLGTDAAPAAGRAVIEVLASPPPLEPRRRVAALGFDAASLSWLGRHGVEAVAAVSGDDALAGEDLVLVGHAGELSPERWAEVAAVVRRGATVVVLCPWELIAADGEPASLPFSTPVSCRKFRDWVYHKECYARRGELIAGLPGPGLMGWRFYGDVLPRHLLDGEAEDVAAFAVAVGVPHPGGYVSGLLAGRFAEGDGRLVVSTFDLLDHLGSLAVADHLMLNLLRYALGAPRPTEASRPAGGPGAASPGAGRKDR